MNSLLIFIFVILWMGGGSYALSQGPTGESADLQNLNQEGQLLSIKMVMGEPIKIFVLGKEEAKIDFSELKLTVRRLKPYPAKVLALTKHGDYYTVDEGEVSAKDSNVQLELKAKVNENEETFRFKIDTKPH